MYSVSRSGISAIALPGHYVIADLERPRIHPALRIVHQICDYALRWRLHSHPIDSSFREVDLALALGALRAHGPGLRLGGGAVKPVGRLLHPRFLLGEAEVELVLLRLNSANDFALRNI